MTMQHLQERSKKTNHQAELVAKMFNFALANREFAQVTQNCQTVYLLCANNIASVAFSSFFLFSQDLRATT